MRKRVLSFLLAASAAFCFICSSVPEAFAVVPIGFVQSALASYVASAGYKLWNDNGTGQDILKSLSDLYDGPFLAFAESSLGVNIEVNDLSYYASNDMVYQDTSGQIVIRKAAADMFQEFADWIQTEYNVTVGSDSPTQVVQPSGGVVTNSNAGDATLFYRPNCFPNGVAVAQNSITYYDVVKYERKEYTLSFTSGYSSGFTYSSYRRGPVVVSESPFSITVNSYTDSSVQGLTKSGQRFYYYVYPLTGYNQANASFNTSTSTTYNLNNYSQSELAADYYTFVTTGTMSGGVSSLGVTLAQAVADVVGQAKEDDAVVIGVGASAGATAQDIADMVAQGIKAQTLNPSVSITAEAVIDTPVQPYPDIESLGLPQLGAALVERFPFCIPWDFVDTLRLFSADPQPINIKVDLIPQRIKTSVGITSDTSFDIDLSGEQYAKIGVFCRWGSLIAFCFGLFLLTKRLVWTA